MRKFLILVSISLATYNLSTAQDKVDQNEVGIAISNFQSIGLTYKIGQSSALWRLNTIVLNGFESSAKADTTVEDKSGFGITIRAGREWRKSPAEKVEIRYGFDLQYSYNKGFNSSNYTGTFRDNAIESNYHRYGVNLVFGANYLFNNNLFLGIEILPNFLIESGTYKTQNLYTGAEQEFKLSGISYGLDSSSALLTFGIRF